MKISKETIIKHQSRKIVYVEEPPMWILAVAVSLMAVIVLVLVHTEAHAEEYSSVSICDAIYRAEGGAHAKYLYGIRSVHYKDAGEAQAICLRTVRHAHRDWVKSGRKGGFLTFLGGRYCPVGCDNDTGTNRYWVKNVESILRRSK